MIGYHIQATDGEIGHVEDFIAEDKTWAIRYIVVDTRSSPPGKKMLVTPWWIEAVKCAEKKVNVSKQSGSFTKALCVPSTLRPLL